MNIPSLIDNLISQGGEITLKSSCPPPDIRNCIVVCNATHEIVTHGGDGRTVEWTFCWIRCTHFGRDFRESARWMKIKKGVFLFYKDRRFRGTGTLVKAGMNFPSSSYPITSILSWRAILQDASGDLFDANTKEIIDIASVENIEILSEAKQADDGN